MEWNVVPVLESQSGEQLHQTLAIARFLGRAHNLVPQDLWQQAKIEAAVESVHELSGKLGGCYFARFVCIALLGRLETYRFFPPSTDCVGSQRMISRIF